MSNERTILNTLSDRWMTSAEVATIAGLGERSTRRVLQETRGIEGRQEGRQWLYRRRQPARAAS